MKSDSPVAVLIMIALAAFLLGKCEGTNLTKVADIDTVVVTRPVIFPPETLFVNKIKGRIIYRDRIVFDTVGIRDTSDLVYLDTIHKPQPFYSYMDTTIGCTTLKLRYSYPENTFDSLLFVSCPDTVMIADTTITKTINATGSFWEDLHSIGIGFVGGFIIGSVVR